MMIKVYGASDDLIEIEGDIREEFSYSDDDPAYIAFSDGTLLEVLYGERGIWRITPLIHGTAKVNKVFTAINADGPDYSDIVEIDGKVEWVVCGKGVCCKEINGFLLKTGAGEHNLNHSFGAIYSFWPGLLVCREVAVLSGDYRASG